jgi:hypothetical protein
MIASGLHVEVGRERFAWEADGVPTRLHIVVSSASWLRREDDLARPVRSTRSPSEDAQSPGKGRYYSLVSPKFTRCISHQKS